MNKLAILTLVGISSIAGAQNKKPNIIFIVTDDQHRNEFNFLKEGQDGENFINYTPNIDKLSSEGVILDNCYITTPICTPSRYSILTGIYASRAQNEGFLEDQKKYNQTNISWNVDIIPGTENIASFLGENGYYTGAVGKNHVIEFENWYKMDKDADPNDPEVKKTLRKNHELQIKAYKSIGFDYAASIYKANLPNNYPLALEYHNNDWIVKGALDFLDLAFEKENPFFLYFATTISHGPHKMGTKYKGNPLSTAAGYLDEPLTVTPSRESITERINERGLDDRAGDVLWLDDGVGALLKKLKDGGVLDNTIIFYVDDHGVENGKGSLYQGGVLTPAFVWGPEFIASGIRSSQLVSNIDLVPTAIELAGLTPPEDYHIDGKSVLPILKGDDVEIHKSLFMEIGATRAVIMDGWKYIAFRTPEEREKKYSAMGKKATHINDQPGGRGSETPAMAKYPHYYEKDQLYNVIEDPDEQTNLYNDKENKKRIEALKKEMKKYLYQLPGGFGEIKVE